MENPKVLIPATMETSRVMDLGGKEEWREEIEGGSDQDRKVECGHVFKTPEDAQVKGAVPSPSAACLRHLP